jgi:hypothetical protein
LGLAYRSLVVIASTIITNPKAISNTPWANVSTIAVFSFLVTRTLRRGEPSGPGTIPVLLRVRRGVRFSDTATDASTADSAIASAKHRQFGGRQRFGANAARARRF